MTERRRHHAALGARILVGGLSAATALGLAGTMAGGVGEPAEGPVPVVPPAVAVPDGVASAPAGGLAATAARPSAAPATTASSAS